MARHTSSLHRALRTGFLQLLLLIGIAALPAFAFAVDSDGDGVDDTGGYGTFTEGFETALSGWTLNPVASNFGRTTTSNGGRINLVRPIRIGVKDSAIKVKTA